MESDNGVFRLGTIFTEGSPSTVVLASDKVYRLADLVGRDPGLKAVIGAWAEHETIIVAALSSNEKPSPLVLEDLRFLPPVPDPPKLICVGTNYHDHLREMKVAEVPKFPYAFLRPNLCLAGHDEDVVLPDWPQFIDWEAEVGLVIGNTGRNFIGDAARQAIAGYTIVNDISARDWIVDRPSVGIDWVMQKAWDGFQPTGPWLTPAEFVADPNNLAIELTVDGVERQRSNTSAMIFSPVQIVEHLSRIMTLECGDIIATGTPAGVGFGQDPRIKLEPGNEMIVTIEGLGLLRNRITRP